MERDHVLLLRAEAGEPGCRVYSWDGPWISLGMQQNPNRDLLDPDLVPWVMRPTGGKAVLHGHDVTVGLALPLPSLPTEMPIDKLARSVKTVYRCIAQPLAKALQESGMPAELAENTRFAGKGHRSADCFAHLSPNDIVDTRTGVKACGCALRITKNAVLLQASIPNGPPLIDPKRLFEKPQPTTYQTWDSTAFAETLLKQLEKHLRL